MPLPDFTPGASSSNVGRRNTGRGQNSRAFGHSTANFGPSPWSGWPLRAGLFTLVFALIGGGAWAATALRDNDPAPAAYAELVPAPVVDERAVCIDRSGSVDQDGRLATRATKALSQQVATWRDWNPQVRRSRPVEAVPGLKMIVKVVREDSYSTVDGDQFMRRVNIPATEGISSAEPMTQGADYAKASDAYEAAHATVTEQTAAAIKARSTAKVAMAESAKLRSNGSDVTGCVLSLAALSTSEIKILVVSDLQDNRLSNPDGTPRVFGGDLSQVRLTVVQACPSGNPAKCEATKRAFLGRLADLGLSAKQVVVRPADDVEDTIEQWMHHA